MIASSITYVPNADQAPCQFKPAGPTGPATPCGPVGPCAPAGYFSYSHSN
jgi:hypothetical protein